ncbi:hypothetical protein DITRI_Ditri03aG0046900 [Diplodiscus trichospermus]
MVPPYSIVSQEEFNMFHIIDRKLYSLLAINLWRDPVESIHVMALWLWLERVGFKNVVRKISSLPYILVNELADEAMTCFNLINNDQLASLSDGSDNPLMQSLIDRDLTFQLFKENRLIATQGVTRIVNQVCMRALRDIMHHAIERNATQRLADSKKVISRSLLQPTVQSGLPQMGSGPCDVTLPWTKENEVPPDDRTMFVTFSKGYPVYDWEVREFFTKAYGDCIESLHMQEVHHPDKQSLFARIVFYSASTIEMILNGVDKAKFTINGKHVWARKFVPKRLKPLSPSAPLVEFPVSCGLYHPFSM